MIAASLMSHKKVEFLWVNTPQALDTFITNLRGYFPIALDTEADSLHHYRESVCLIQVTHDSRHFLIDPLDDFPLEELWPPTSRHTWILHGADFDLRMLRRAGAPEPQAVFDTMLAAQLLGLKAFGYGALVPAILRHHARQGQPEGRLVAPPAFANDDRLRRAGHGIPGADRGDAGRTARGKGPPRVA